MVFLPTLQRCMGESRDFVQLCFQDYDWLGYDERLNAVGFHSLMFEASIFCFFRRSLLGQDKLVRGVITYFDEVQTDSHIVEVYSMVKEGLLDEFGAPAQIVENCKDAPSEVRLSEMLVWVVGDCILTLSMGLKRDGVSKDNIGINVGYGHIRKDPASRQWSWLKGL